MTVPQAIARMEGWYVAGSLAQENNNPGNLRHGPFTMRHNGFEGLRGFAAFPTAREGWAALYALLQGDYIWLTLEQLVRKWAPPNENQTAAYLRNLSAWTELPTTAVLAPVRFLPPAQGIA